MIPGRVRDSFRSQTLTGGRLRDNPPESKFDRRARPASAGSTAQPRQPARQPGGAPGTGGGDHPDSEWGLTRAGYHAHSFASPRLAPRAARPRANATEPNPISRLGSLSLTPPNLRYIHRVYESFRVSADAYKYGDDKQRWKPYIVMQKREDGHRNGGRGGR